MHNENVVKTSFTDANDIPIAPIFANPTWIVSCIVSFTVDFILKFFIAYNDT